jgi:nucleoside-diphosphate-sugar epimerase
MIPHDLHHFFVGQHVFVTGASGFIGGHVASLLDQTGAHVRAFTRSIKGRRDSAIDWVEGDLLARDSIDAAMKDCRYVFHVAGDYRFWARNPREIFGNNVQHSLFFVHRCIPVVGGRATWCQRLARRQMKRREVFPF